MFGSVVVYTGLVIATAGLVCLVKPIHRLRVTTRRRGLLMALVGVALTGLGLILPAPETRVGTAATRLDEYMPVWQFREFHTISVAAPPDRVFDAIKSVRADQIFLFRALTWIRRAGQPLPPGVLNAGTRESLVDVALRGGFVLLAEDPPRELVIGTAVMGPQARRDALTPQDFHADLPPGFALAAMGFVVRADGPDRSIVSTETRVFANSPSARRRFAAYWRLIYPGSAFIRRMWLRAVRREATDPARESTSGSERTRRSVVGPDRFRSAAADVDSPRRSRGGWG